MFPITGTDSYKDMKASSGIELTVRLTVRELAHLTSNHIRQRFDIYLKHYICAGTIYGHSVGIRAHMAKYYYCEFIATNSSVLAGYY